MSQELLIAILTVLVPAIVAVAIAFVPGALLEEIEG